MADTQAEVYGQAYARNIMQLAQEKYSKLLPICYLKPNVKGKTFFQDRISIHFYDYFHLIVIVI